MNKCTKRNPEPPCKNTYSPRKNKWGNLCCYKTKKINKCSKRNPEPPCESGYYSKKNLKGNVCCYKDSKSMIHKIQEFILIPNLEVNIDLASNTIQFSGNTYNIKDTIKQASKSINKHAKWDNILKTWEAPLDIIYTDDVKDIIDINLFIHGLLCCM